ncbi:MAG: DUF1538 domain-containing protein [Eubacteriaceae bacterium]|jgi:hypothetical protein|nr:DUF1538 domain-containing protein [Eubacteriaceae bacterium]
MKFKDTKLIDRLTEGGGLLSILLEKLKEVLYSVIPITVLVLILNFLFLRLDSLLIVRFLMGSLLIIIGLTIFLFGIDIGITPIGENMGRLLMRLSTIVGIGLLALVLGFFISIAEPDLHILAQQVENIALKTMSKNFVVLVVSLGVGAMISVGILRIVKQVRLTKVFIGAYCVIFALVALVPQEYVAMAFDASGATTGALTVPFMLALAYGVAIRQRDSLKAEADSFGLVGLASSGAIMGLLFAVALFRPQLPNSETLVTAEPAVSSGLVQPFIDILPYTLQDVAFALLPIVIIFLLANGFYLRLPKRTRRQIFVGIIYSFIGLIVFLVGVNGGFMEIGRLIGFQLATTQSKIVLLVVGFLMGVTTILAEPAVLVLSQQIEETTAGSVKKTWLYFALCTGVGLAILFALSRILYPGVHLYHFLITGYVIIFIIIFKVPELFVGMAFDSGGVASGPMTATFIFAFVQGIAHATDPSNIILNSFGMITMVAMMPILSIMLLGIFYQFMLTRSRIGKGEDDYE